EFGIPVYPIVGTGSLPFRGGINPDNIENSLPQYEGAKTVTIQSAFKYDYPIQDVKKALDFIEKKLTKVKPVKFGDDEFQTMEVLNDIFKNFYRPTIEKFAPMINRMAQFVPNRRERLQHIGLLGYSRGVGEVALPRAIKFTAACYSMGIPPEFIGTGRGLKEVRAKGMTETLNAHFKTLKWELSHAGKFVNKENIMLFAKKYDWAREIMLDIELCEEILGIELGPQKDRHFLHRNLTSNIMVKHGLGMDFEDDLLEAAIMRKSLG
ncbi:phosphoenolpyruvate carboxylase, partial [Candidatus Peregrinibacteria bacterium CG10_big_fil_rev_8_21_14_0_10_44_7]